VAAPSAKNLFDQGKALFDKSDYANAVAKWNESRPPDIPVG